MFQCSLLLVAIHFMALGPCVVVGLSGIQDALRSFGNKTRGNRVARHVQPTQSTHGQDESILFTMLKEAMPLTKAGAKNRNRAWNKFVRKPQRQPHMALAKPDASQSMGVIVLTMHACEYNGSALLQRRSNKRRTSVRSTWEVGMQTSTCGRTA